MKGEAESWGEEIRNEMVGRTPTIGSAGRVDPGREER